MNKQITIVISILLSFSFGVGWTQIIDIPDANFKNALLNTNCADFNGDGNFTSQVDLNNNDEVELFEIQGIQGLSVVNQDITSLEGLENFTDLTYLNVQFNALETMNISALSNLRSLLCDGNELTSLDVSSNLDLEVLACSDNQLTVLDVTLNTNLVDLEFFINQLTGIDLTLNTNLETLNCSLNQLSTLDVTNNLQLRSLLASNTDISVLDLSNNLLLENLTATNNNLTSIDLNDNLNLFSVWLSNNLLSEIDVSNNPSVFELIVENNDLINANIKNGSSFMIYSGFFGNPNLEFICADAFEIAAVQAELDALGYTETLVSDDCSLGLDDYNVTSQIKVFPVPFKNQLFLQSNDQIEQITIFKSDGNKVLDFALFEMQSMIDTEMLSNGLYIIKVKTSKGTDFKKIIKK